MSKNITLTSKTGTICFSAAVFLCAFFATNLNEAHAAKINLVTKAETVNVDDVFIVEARVSSPGESINAADGSILFDKNMLEVREVSSGGSIFGVWAQSPSFSNEEGKVSFIGGTPDGFSGEDGLMMRTIFVAKKKGEVKVSYNDSFSIFLNDGKGTKLFPGALPLVLSISERPPQTPPRDEWAELIGTDTTSPEFVEAIIATDSQIFGGKHFLSFFAEDKGSGVAFYEVKEGEHDYVRAVSPYLLQDQTLASDIHIKVVDSAGNETIATPRIVPIQNVPLYKSPLFLSLIVLFAVAGFFGSMFRFRKKNDI